jgi:sugar/nucleoside kinase (ribokinase family)
VSGATAVLDLIAVGDVLVDVSVEQRVLERGGHVAGGVRLRPGGSAANAGAWAAAGGARAAVVGRVGDDLGGRILRLALEERGIEARLAVDAEAPTGIFLTTGGTVVVERGANARFAPADVPAALSAGAVLVSGYILLHDDSEAAASAAFERARATWVAVDSASAGLVRRYGRERFFSATAAASVLLANEEEALALTGEAPEQAARTLGRRYQLACVKKGHAGAVACLGGELARAQAPRIEVADSTGAGDAFAAAFLVALAAGRPLADALATGCEAGGAAAASLDPWPTDGRRRR